jgi:sporulation protein YlmC with PRC-barrel domain
MNKNAIEHTSHKTGATPDSDMEITSLIGREVYTSNGVFIGEVEDVKLDFDTQNVDRLALDYTNSELFNIPRNKTGVLLPFRWVKSIGDIIVTADFVESLDTDELG